MKKILLFGLSALLFACSKDDDVNFIAPVAHNFEISYNENYDHQFAANAEVKLVNNDDGKNYSVVTDISGIASLEVVPGIYKVNVSRTFTPEQYQEFSGQEVQENVTFNASLENLVINETSNTSTSLELVTGRIGNLIIKQIYHAGSDIRLGASFRDLFIEIHNNSNETIYLDGLHIAQIKGTSSVSSTPKDYYLPNGQYDWSMSIGQADIENANSKYVYSDEVIKIPGNGTEYPLGSGKSVIIAATAVNHKAPLVVQDEEGETVTFEVPEPERTIDLSQAPFEAYYRPYQESQGKTWLDSDIDNPNAVNMEVEFKSYGGKDLILDPFGREALVIFFTSETEFSEWNAVPLPSVGIDGYDDEVATFKQIPNSALLDGVELQNIDPSKAKPKRLADEIDAGEIATISGKYSSESVIRKVKRELDGKVFYQDTNNSSNDFEVLAHPQVIIE
ncbi:DUF4876 domain-containing protein [Gillisia sp. M10.2A]|uniref:DUF4876 domain-containing protein n=1 Tax=Gillisia lutea TaxID=2909668 RepID=A0ABS9EJJ0_9FLAO|nr:DUF4876 domain-containing protein [Gillisia lutea]MCF4102354.1 DUF4876 domain-containing protein [Gillisia lutea]